MTRIGQAYWPNKTRYGRHARLAAFLLGGVILVVWGIWGTLPHASLRALFHPIVATDIHQQRRDTGSLVLQGNFSLEQTFTPRWNGLHELEIHFYRADETPGAGQIYLRLQDAGGQTVSEATLPNATIAHNQAHKLQFSPQPHSAGQVYTLVIRGDAENAVALWGYSLETYAGGELALVYGPLAAETAVTTSHPADLTFTTRYQLTWGDALAYLGRTLAQEGGLLLLAVAFLLLPGALLLRLWRRPWPRWDGAAWVGTALALGTAVWPLLWQFFTLLGGRWRGWSLWAVFILGWLAVFWLGWGRRNAEIRRESAEMRRGITKRRLFSPLPLRPSAPLLLLLLLTLGLAVRLLAVRHINTPPWVDASRHGLITAVMGDSGQTISNYGAYLPVDRFPYHYGFHTLSASLAQMTGHPLPALLLYLGQLLNALVPLTTYAALWLLTRRRDAALLAAFLVALPFFFPGYYATWGRLTQLTAVLILPLTLAFTWLVVRGGRAWRRGWWLLALLVAGLFLVHFRVFTYFLPFAGLVWLVSGGRNGRYLAASAILGLLLVAPRLWQLLAVTVPAQAIRGGPGGYNAFPTGYLDAGWERAFILAAALGLIWVLAGALRRRPWATLPLVLAAWVASLFLLLAGERLGLPETWLVNLNSMYITLFLPLAMLLVMTATRAWHWLARQRWGLQMPGSLLAGGLLAALFLFGVRNQVNILNPQTILAEAPDLAGIAWVDIHLPPEALIAVSSWQWLGQTWAGQDGGAWLTPLTQRQTTTPPADYIYNRDLAEEVRAFNETAVAVADWSDPTQAAWLRRQGVTHVFVGARGGFFDPAALARNPEMTLLYAVDGVFVFALK